MRAGNVFALMSAAAILAVGMVALPAGAGPDHYTVNGDCYAGFNGAKAEVEAQNPHFNGAEAYAKAFVRRVLEDTEEAEDGPWYNAGGATAEVDLTRLWIARVATSHWRGWVGAHDGFTHERDCLHNCYTVWEDCLPVANLPEWALEQLHGVGCGWSTGAFPYGFSGDLYLDPGPETLILRQTSSWVNLTATPMLSAAAQVSAGAGSASAEPVGVRLDAFGNKDVGCRFSVHQII